MFATLDLFAPKTVLIRIAGCGIALLIMGLPLWGTVKCLLIAQRPTTNTKAAWSLAAVFAMFTLPGLALLAGILMQGLVEGRALGDKLGVGLSILILGLLGTGSILSIIALVEIKRDHEGRYVQGKWQAIWALIISSGLIWVVFPYGGAAMREVQQRRLAAAAGPAFGKGMDRRDEFNFQLRPLGSGWVSVDAKRLNPVATIAYLRKWPEMSLTVIAEALGVEADVNLDRLSEIARAQLAAAMTSMGPMEQQPFQIDKIQGLRCVNEATVGNNEIFFVRWLGVYHGYVYQLIATGKREDRTEIEKEADEAFHCFELIDPERVCHVKGFSAMENLASAEFGIRLELQNTGWRKWGDLASKHPSAEFGGLRGKSEGMAVIPVDANDFQIAPQTALEAFLELASCPQPQTIATQGENAAPVGSAPCIQCEFSRSVNQNELFYRIAMVQKNGCDYCFMVWSAESKQEAQTALQEIFARAIHRHSAAEIAID